MCLLCSWRWRRRIRSRKQPSRSKWTIRWVLDLSCPLSSVLELPDLYLCSITGPTWSASRELWWKESQFWLSVSWPRSLGSRERELLNFGFSLQAPSWVSFRWSWFPPKEPLHLFRSCVARLSRSPWLFLRWEPTCSPAMGPKPVKTSGWLPKASNTKTRIHKECVPQNFSLSAQDNCTVLIEKNFLTMKWWKTIFCKTFIQLVLARGWTNTSASLISTLRNTCTNVQVTLILAVDRQLHVYIR